jgi:glutathione S-transferase
MITVHHLEHSRSQRVLWLLEELGVDYDVKRYARDPASSLAPVALRDVHPLGKSPVVTDGDITVAESGAILEYLVDRFGPHLRPAVGTLAQRRYTYWMHFAEGSAMPNLVMALIFGRIRQAPMPFFAKPIAKGIADKVINSFIDPNIARQMDYIERELHSRPWFCGDDFSAADVMMSFPLEAAAARKRLDATKHPHTTAWLAKLHVRPAYKRALERGGPYRLLD